MTREWKQEVSEFLKRGSAIVGIGNRLRGDDAFGPLVVDRLRARSDLPWRALDAGETPENIAGVIATLEPRSVLLVDACRSGGVPGEIGVFPKQAIPYGALSTHAPSLRMFAEFLSWRASCPVALLGVEPLGLNMGSTLSHEVEHSLDAVIELLDHLACSPTSACAQA